MHATSFQNLQGTCTPPEAACPGSSRPVACPRQVWPGTGFLRNPGVTPAPEAAGTKTRDGIKDRLWAQLLFLGDSATWELQRLPLMFGALQSKILLNECATCVTGTRVVVGVDASFIGARDGCPGFMTAGTWHVHSYLHGLLQPKELPGHQVHPAGPHSTGLMHPVLLGVPTRFCRGLFAALVFAALVSWDHLLTPVPLTVTAIATLQPPGQAPGTGAQGALLGRVGWAIRPGQPPQGRGGGGDGGGGSGGRGADCTFQAFDCSLERQRGLLEGAFQPHLLLEFWFLFGEAVFRVVGATEVPEVLEVGRVLAEAADKARGTQGLGHHRPQMHGGGEGQGGPRLWRRRASRECG